MGNPPALLRTLRVGLLRDKVTPTDAEKTADELILEVEARKLKQKEPTAFIHDWTEGKANDS
jgi:hypothetical protein